MSPAPPEPPRTDRWQYLLQLAMGLEEQVAPGGAQVRQVLESALEVFPGALDPVDDFEAYSVRQFARALHRALHGRADSR